MPNSVITQKRFASIDDLEATYSQRQAFQVVQFESGQLNCEIYRLALTEAIFEFRAVNTPLRIWGDKVSDHLTFELVLSPICGNYLSHGFSLTPNTLYGFDSERGIDLVLPKQILMGTLMIQREVFERCITVMERFDLDQRFLSQNYIQLPTTLGPVQDYLRELYSLVTKRAQFLDQAIVHKLLLADYLPLLIQAIPPVGKPSQKPPKFLKRSLLVREVEAYLLNHLAHPITLQELCQLFHTSKTPLTYGFQEVVGMSPLAYLKILRLHAIRRVLKSASPQSKLVPLMHQFGFWHPGRFSQDYKTLFGESPSETLKQ